MKRYLMKGISVFVLLGSCLLAGHYWHWWMYQDYLVLTIALFLVIMSVLSMMEGYKFYLNLLNPYNLTGLLVGFILFISQLPLGILNMRDTIFLCGLMSCTIFSIYTLCQAFMPSKQMIPEKINNKKD